MSCKTVMNKFAANSISNTGMKLLKRSARALPSSVTRSERSARSAAVGCGILVISQPSNDSSGKAKAPIKAGIQNSLMWRCSITNSPTDFAVPELMAMLSPIRLASRSVTRRPSRKLKITPHMHPNESPLKHSDIQRPGQRSEQHQRKLGHRHREDDELQTVLLLQFRNYLDANQLGNKIAGNLHDAGCRLVIHPEEVEPVEARSRKRLAQRIDQ